MEKPRDEPRAKVTFTKVILSYGYTMCNTRIRDISVCRLQMHDLGIQKDDEQHKKTLKPDIVLHKNGYPSFQ